MELKFTLVKSEPGFIAIHISDDIQKIGKLNIKGAGAKLTLEKKALPISSFPETYKLILAEQNNLLEGKDLEIIYEEGVL